MMTDADVDEFVIQRFMAKVDRSGDCWEWTAWKSDRGYGRFHIGGSDINAHRAAWIIFRGPIPKGLVVDHLCRNPGCANPAHLEPVSNRTNVLRGVGPSAENSLKTHCKHGHEFTPENTYITPKGYRYCRECKRSIDRRKRMDPAFRARENVQRKARREGS